jgi:hypothetical protein
MKNFILYIFLTLTPSLLVSCTSYKHCSIKQGISFQYPDSFKAVISKKGVVLIRNEDKLRECIWDEENNQSISNGIRIEKLEGDFFHYFKERLLPSQKEQHGSNTIYNKSKRLITAKILPPPMYTYFIHFKTENELWVVSAVIDEDDSYDSLTKSAIICILESIKKDDIY